MVRPLSPYWASRAAVSRSQSPTLSSRVALINSMVYFFTAGLTAIGLVVGALRTTCLPIRLSSGTKITTSARIWAWQARR